MNIFVVLSRVPYPLEKGDKLRAYHQLKELKKQHHITLVCLSDSHIDGAARQALHPVCHALHVYRLSRMWRVFQLILAFFSRRPFQVAYFYQHKIHEKVRRLIDEVCPDRIFCQLVRTAEYAKGEHAYIKTLDYQDAFSKGMERRIENSPAIMRWILRSEKKRLIEYENLIFEYFERKTIISAQDRNFILHNRRKHITVVPNGVDTDFFSSRHNGSDYDVVFTGNMSYPPNINSAKMLALQVMPLLKKRKPTARLLIAGANPAPSVRALAGKNIDVSGWVQDIRDAYARGTVFAAPMKMGSGLQNKLLEAMAMEIPSVTTSLVNKALGAASETNVLLAETAEEFANQIYRLLEDKELHEQLAHRGRQFVIERYSWQKSTQILEKVLRCGSKAVD